MKYFWVNDTIKSFQILLLKHQEIQQMKSLPILLSCLFQSKQYHLKPRETKHPILLLQSLRKLIFHNLLSFYTHLHLFSYYVAFLITLLHNITVSILSTGKSFFNGGCYVAKSLFWGFPHLFTFLRKFITSVFANGFKSLNTLRGATLDIEIISFAKNAWFFIGGGF